MKECCFIFKWQKYLKMFLFILERNTFLLYFVEFLISISLFDWKIVFFFCQNFWLSLALKKSWGVWGRPGAACPSCGHGEAVLSLRELRTRARLSAVRTRSWYLRMRFSSWNWSILERMRAKKTNHICSKFLILQQKGVCARSTLGRAGVRPGWSHI